MWTLMMSPLAKGLFHAAVDMSGSYVYNATLKQAESDNLVFLRKTGCSNVTCLRRLSIRQILQVGDIWTFSSFSQLSESFDVKSVKVERKSSNKEKDITVVIIFNIPFNI